MKYQILLTTIIFLQLATPAFAQESLGQSEWIGSESASGPSDQMAAGGQLGQSELINSDKMRQLETPITGESDTSSMNSPASLGQSGWIQANSAPSPNSASMGQSQLMQAAPSSTNSGQLGQSQWMQAQSQSANSQSGQLGQSEMIQSGGQNSPELQGTVTRRVKAPGGMGAGLATLAESFGRTLAPMAMMAASSSMMGGFGGGYRVPGFYSAFGNPYFPVYGMPVSRGGAMAGAASYMAGQAVNQMLRQLH